MGQGGGWGEVVWGCLVGEGLLRGQPQVPPAADWCGAVPTCLPACLPCTRHGLQGEPLKGSACLSSSPRRTQRDLQVAQIELAATQEQYTRDIKAQVWGGVGLFYFPWQMFRRVTSVGFGAGGKPRASALCQLLPRPCCRPSSCARLACHTAGPAGRRGGCPHSQPGGFGQDAEGGVRPGGRAAGRR